MTNVADASVVDRFICAAKLDAVLELQKVVFVDAIQTVVIDRPVNVLGKLEQPSQE